MNYFEIVLIGTGGGYGESVLVKFCNDDWIIIDSCIDPYSQKPLPLIYLNSIGVNVSQNVKMIVCTHWHDDHIKGMERILNACENAKFCVTKTFDKDKFLMFIGYDSRQEKEGTSSTKVFGKCLDILSKRRSSCVQAYADKIIYNELYNGKRMEMYCLSPLDETIIKFEQELSQYMKIKSNKKIPYISPNNKGVVLSVNIDGYSVLLGADYESKNNSWKVLLSNSIAIKGKKFSLVKIPHHGSENAYEETLWTNYATNDVCGIISTFQRGNIFLPKKDMIKKYSSCTKDLYITSSKKSCKVKDRERISAKIIKEMNKSIQEIPYIYGAIHCKMDINCNNSQWNVILEGTARKVDNTLLNEI